MRNYSKMLRQLQMAYMPVTMRNEKETDHKCMYCWKSDCGCHEKGIKQIEDDSFLNLTTIGEFKYA